LPRIQRVVAVIVGLLLLISVGAGVLVTSRAMMRVFGSLNSSVAVAIIAAAATVLVSVLSIVLGKVYESRSLIKKEHREKKIPVYEDLIKFMFRILMGTKTDTPISEKETIEFLSDFTQRALWFGVRTRYWPDGSNGVVC
jgi:hypothetical protein